VVLLQVIYVSNALHPAGCKNDFDILTEARGFNERNGISGYLLRTPLQYFQVLEGRQDCVELLMNKITSDPRNDNLQVLRSIDRIAPQFSSWSMGFKILTAVSDPIFKPQPQRTKQDAGPILDAMVRIADLEANIASPPKPLS
jgi:hypothetical protein